MSPLSKRKSPYEHVVHEHARTLPGKNTKTNVTQYMRGDGDKAIPPKRGRVVGDPSSGPYTVIVFYDKDEETARVTASDYPDATEKGLLARDLFTVPRLVRIRGEVK